MFANTEGNLNIRKESEQLQAMAAYQLCFNIRSCVRLS